MQKRTNEILCRTEPKQFKFIKNQLLPFLKKLFVFISAIVSNIHWIEKELHDSLEIQRELAFKDFVLFPSGDHIVVIRKNRQAASLKSISVLINLKNCRFLVEKNSAQAFDWDEDDFNKILLEPPFVLPHLSESRQSRHQMK